MVSGVRHPAGLSSTEAARTLARVGPNLLPPAAIESTTAKILRSLREPMSLLLLVAAGVSGILLGETVDGIAISAVVALNVAIGVAQEQKAEGALKALREMQTPVARVMRDGAPIQVAAADVVPGDVLLLAAGDGICADGTVIAASEFTVDESLLTGESLPVTRATGDRLWSATSVSGGTASMLVDKTGSDTRLGGIAAQLEAPDTATPLQTKLTSLSVRLGIGAGVIAIAVFAIISVTTGDWRLGFLTAVALAVAAVPEGLPTAVVLALALGVTRMARRGAIVRRLSAVETLGAATVILTDKTGTLTLNQVAVSALITGRGEILALEDVDGSLRAAAARVAVTCNDATVDPPSGDALDLGLLREFGQAGASPTTRILEAPFNSSTRRHAVVADDGHGPCLFVKGAPEVVLKAAGLVLDQSGNPEDLDDDRRARLLEIVGAEANSGSRLLALALRRLSTVPEAIMAEEHDLILVGIVALRDPVRPGAATTVQAARSAGIAVVMVTGDHPGTAAAVASSTGIPTDRIVTGTDLRETQGAGDLPAATIYARVEPEQKLAIVESLRSAGEVVAVKGDGVNDAPALKAADIGVAMGAGGTEVARQAADIVITDDDLETVVAAIEEGRGIYDNIRKTVAYLVAGNVSELAVVIGALILIPELAIPLLPLQLLFINLVTDGLPALALGVDPPAHGIMHRPPRNPGDSLLDRRRIAELAGRGLIMAIGPLAVGYLVAASVGPEPARSAMFVALLITHLGYAYVVRYPSPGSNRMLAAAIAGGLLLVVLAVLAQPLAGLLDLSAPSIGQWTLIAAGSAAPLLVLWIGATRRIGQERVPVQ